MPTIVGTQALRINQGGSCAGLIYDGIEWFEFRATLGRNWEQAEPRMMYWERRTRICMNVISRDGSSEDDLDPPPSWDATQKAPD